MLNDLILTEYGNFVKIPPGKFSIGNNKVYSSYFGKECIEREQARNVHEVKISNQFAVLESSVTVMQFKSFIEETKYSLDDIRYSYLANKSSLKEYCSTDKLEDEFQLKWIKKDL